MRHINWVVKASKLCNLRCSYCYEWNDLAKRERISLEGWEKLLRAILSYHDFRARETGVRQRSNIIWHGGEPTLLPLDYIREVLQMERSILGEERLKAGEFRNALQTNLYRLGAGMAELLAEGMFDLGVSFDLVPGTRLSVGGKTTERKVAENLDMFRKLGVSMGAIVVLADHTAERIIDIYDYFETLRMPVRFLPLFQSPRSQEPGIAISDKAIQDALRKLFLHWIKREHPVRVSPLLDHVYTILLKLRGERQPPYDRRVSGEWALLVNTDGELYQRLDAYIPERSLGNVFTEPIESILKSESYEASLRRDDALWERYCKGCEFEGPCTSLDVFESPYADNGERRCVISYPLNRFILHYLTAKKKYTHKEIGSFVGRCNAPLKPIRRSTDALKSEQTR
jgi:uncharacterized protein